MFLRKVSMNKVALIIAASIFFLLTGCASTAYQPKVDFDRNENITTEHYKTFAWLKETKILAMPEDFNPVMKSRFDSAIEQAFIAKGYKLTEDSENADFTISYTLGSREKVKVDTFPHGYRFSWGWGRHYYNGIYMAHENRVRSYQEGKLAIDVFDVKSKTPAWHGWAVQRIHTKDAENPGKAIKPVVDLLVSQF